MKRLRLGGFSLIEVLVAVVILAVGLMGAGLLSAVAVRRNHEISLHGIAVSLSDEMANLMRSNPIGVWQGAYDGSYSSPYQASTCGTGSACVPSALAKAHLAGWTRKLRVLPAVKADVACTRSSPMPGPDELSKAPSFDGVCRVAITWSEVAVPDQSGAPAPRQMNVALAFQP